MRSWPNPGFGVALKARHYRQFLQQKPAADWLEVHSENYFGAGGLDLHVLEQLRADYPLSLHGVGMGIASAQGFSDVHLQRLQQLVQRLQPMLVSEHLCWGALADRNLNDLLPFSFNSHSLQRVCERVARVQDALGRQILLENVSTYVRYADACSETAFLAEVVRRTGCGVLLDVNNLYVNQCNHGEDALQAMAQLPPGCVGEIHLAGHLVQPHVVIDDHGSEVCDAVWELYRAALQRFGPVATMIEWDTNIPPLETLLAQADLARSHAQQVFGMSPANVESAPLLLPPADDELLQQRFGMALFEPALQAQVLPDFQPRPQPAVALAQRYAQYRGNLQAHWSMALESTFPVLKKLVGDEFFAAMARDYGRAHPSRSADLNQFGAELADFLQELPAAAAYPYFPDMARLEWAVFQAYYAADASPMSAAQFAAMQPDVLENSCFRLAPAVTLLHSSYPVAAIWQAHQGEAVADFPTDAADSWLAVVRPNWFARVLPLSAGGHAALQALQQGQNMGAALDAALACDEAFPFASWLQDCLQHSIFCAMPSA